MVGVEGAFGEPLNGWAYETSSLNESEMCKAEMKEVERRELCIPCRPSAAARSVARQQQLGHTAHAAVRQPGNHLAQTQADGAVLLRHGVRRAHKGRAEHTLFGVVVHKGVVDRADAALHVGRALARVAPPAPVALQPTGWVEHRAGRFERLPAWGGLTLAQPQPATHVTAAPSATAAPWQRTCCTVKAAPLIVLTATQP